jgi:uncharacterized protein (TIGR02611 family)
VSDQDVGAERPGKGERTRRWARWREGIRGKPATELAYRIVVGVVGLVMLVVGIIAIPYPGPGIAICFVALTILATEFAWARRAHGWARRRVDPVVAWFATRGRWGRALGTVLTGVVLVGSLWVFGVLGWTASMLGFERDWLYSPIGLGG